MKGEYFSLGQNQAAGQAMMPGYKTAPAFLEGIVSFGSKRTVLVALMDGENNSTHGGGLTGAHYQVTLSAPDLQEFLGEARKSQPQNMFASLALGLLHLNGEPVGVRLLSPSEIADANKMRIELDSISGKNGHRGYNGLFEYGGSANHGENTESSRRGFDADSDATMTARSRQPMQFSEDWATLGEEPPKSRMPLHLVLQEIESEMPQFNSRHRRGSEDLSHDFFHC